jgi:hypothetical protein
VLITPPMLPPSMLPPTVAAALVWLAVLAVLIASARVRIPRRARAQATMHRSASPRRGANRSPMSNDARCEPDQPRKAA